LDASVLVPPGLRDLLLSCAFCDCFRPVWQDEIENEVHRNGTRLRVQRGDTEGTATVAMDRVIAEMRNAFPAARLDPRSWLPLVPHMTNHRKNRHVLAAAIGSHATHVVTDNLRDFPVRSRPPGIDVVTPDAFLLDLLQHDPAAITAAVRAMARRHRTPPHTTQQLAKFIADGVFTPKFGVALMNLLE
jgi:hypothetical protein